MLRVRRAEPTRGQDLQVEWEAPPPGLGSGWAHGAFERPCRPKACHCHICSHAASRTSPSDPYLPDAGRPMSPGERAVLCADLHVAYRLQRADTDRGLPRTILVSLMVSATVIPEKQQERDVAVPVDGGSEIQLNSRSDVRIKFEPPQVAL